MAMIIDAAKDAKLAYLTANTTQLLLCSQVPTTFTEATSTYKLGTKASPTFTGPAAGTPSGRKIGLAAITDGVVNSAGTANGWALCSGSVLLAAGAMTAKNLATGSPWTLSAQDLFTDLEAT